MSELDKSAFQDMRNALLTVRILARLQEERPKNTWLDNIIREEEEKNGYSQQVPLVNQSTFLAMLCLTGLWLREAYFKDKCAKPILRKHIAPFVCDKKIVVEYGNQATKFSKKHAEKFAYRIRNAIAHAKINISGSS